MIPRDYISEWRTEAPWVQDFQVEQDLVISRALVEIFSNKVLHDSLAWRRCAPSSIRGSASLSGNRPRGVSPR